ncbi:hypothetical protein VTP01DRAFT_1350 [Rhizomucor pusillus]|uniref:uncharacterized protein n=1 Tax=Rhizomucor pusillus TaxID=4840 RepID=UPI0037439CDB
MQPLSSSSSRPVLPPISSIDARWPPTPERTILPAMSLPSPPSRHEDIPFEKNVRLNPPSAFHRHIQVQPSPSTAVLTNIYKDMDQIIEQCSSMRDTVSRERTWCSSSQFPLLTPDGNPRPWVDEMIGRANEVLNALLRLQKHQLAAQQEKRRLYYYGEQIDSNDLRVLRQRKRKRAPFQGRCHSCNISETPEWRRGPDGARTLCNACGLHYAKLERKQRAAEKTRITTAKEEETIATAAASDTGTTASSPISSCSSSS